MGILDFNDVFTETAAVLALAALAGLLSNTLRQPLVIAFILVGIMVGPVGTGWVTGEDPMELFAEMGITLLLFVVGLKLDLHLIRSLGRVVLAIGLAQVLVTALIAYAMAVLLGIPHLASIYVALGLAFSSTVIIVKLLSDKHELDSLHGRLALGILIIQDLIVVFAMIALTALEGDMESAGLDMLMMPVKGILFLVVVTFCIRYLSPIFQHRLARSLELMMLTSIAWALVLAVAGDALGFSREVGAFVAGVALASSPYRSAIGAKLAPLRDFLLLFFFIDLGAHLDPDQLQGQLWNALTLGVFVLFGKPLIIAVILGIAGFRKRTLSLTALSMGQISEFSLILAFVGYSLGHVNLQTVNLVILVALSTIALSGYLISYMEFFYEKSVFFWAMFEKTIPYREKNMDSASRNKPVDIILFGLGRYGERMAQQFKQRGLTVLCVDFNPDMVRQSIAAGFNAHYCDAEDQDMVAELPLFRAHWIISSIRDLHINMALLHALRRMRYKNKIAIAAQTGYEVNKLRYEGVDLVLQLYRDAADKAVDLVTDYQEPASRIKLTEKHSLHSNNQ